MLLLSIGGYTPWLRVEPFEAREECAGPARLRNGTSMRMAQRGTRVDWSTAEQSIVATTISPPSWWSYCSRYK